MQPSVWLAGGGNSSRVRGTASVTLRVQRPPRSVCERAQCSVQFSSVRSQCTRRYRGHPVRLPVAVVVNSAGAGGRRRSWPRVRVAPRVDPAPRRVPPGGLHGRVRLYPAPDSGGGSWYQCLGEHGRPGTTVSNGCCAGGRAVLLAAPA